MNHTIWQPMPPHTQPHRPWRFNPWLLWLLLGTLLAVAPAHADFQVEGVAPEQQRVALLIGNASYQSAPLSNPPNDVREMEAALKATGFKVQKVLNANQGQMKRALRDFGEAAKGAEFAFLYYSGHGTQIQGQNYLIPVGAEAAINKESDYEIEAVSTSHIMSQLAAAQPKAAVVVLDACRNNPFARSIKSVQKGLTRIVSPQGILVAYATSPDNTADDNGDYARALARHITMPGLELVQVFRNTARQVQQSSNGKQVPFIGDLSINDNVYLASPPEPARITPPAQPTAQTLDDRYQILAGGAEVKDLSTGLVWQRCSVGQTWDGQTCAGQAKEFNFEQAKALSRNGWRVPGKDELASLVDQQAGPLTIHAQAFPATPAIYYWSSTPYDGYASFAWYVGFGNGSVYGNLRDNTYPVRLVR